MPEILTDWYQRGLRYAPGFWKRFLSDKKVKELNLFGDLELRPYLKALIGDKKEVNIIDIGCGAISWIGNICEGVKINLFPVDIMADEYRNVLKSLKISPPFLVEKQDMEKLTYQDNFFDIVYCANALDHTINPKVALQEMIRVCKPGGYIYLRHSPNEGRREKYKFLHHWNICIDKGDCLFWDKENKENFYLSSVAPGFINERKLDWDGWDSSKPVLVSILRKP